jgi:hypothetical protein
MKIIINNEQDTKEYMEKYTTTNPMEATFKQRQHYYLSTQLDKERLFNFLKDDLGKLEQDIKENNKEKIEQFFSYWKQHINDLNK